MVSVRHSRGLMAAGNPSVVRCLVWQNLAGLGASARMLLGGVVVEWNATGLPMHRSGSLGWAWATSSFITDTVSTPSMSGARFLEIDATIA